MSSSGPPAPERVDGRTLRHRHRRPEIVAALAAYLLEQGIADLSLRPAAEAIGVTHATLLRHFASKDQLITEVVRRIEADLISRTDADLAADTSSTIGAFILRQWDRLTTPEEIRQFVLLSELVSRHSHATSADERDLGRALSDGLTMSLAGSLVRRFGLTSDRSTDLAVLVTAAVRGLATDVVLSGDRLRADRAMRVFVAFVDVDPPGDGDIQAHT